MQPKPKNKVQLVTITGGTASGQTTAANKIAEILQGKKIVYLKMDHYYKKLDDLTLAARKKLILIIQMPLI
ncbi:hypothetical protein M1771_03680 [Spiroplasma citri]|uniref:UDP-N-acetylglucosamine kinase n=1 Tax=Spiroplasma citri TaxID=2133 RepID=A0AAX3T0M3_SPICI|nr:hypothetical protein [Spiroplasma citri]WFG97109.1 hypothetical protein M0C40_03670 [Spiroplasma citri]WFH01012.1 hypothetical protein M1771_03680 [Spiroplasma citri]